MEVHTPSPLQTVYVQRTINLDNDVLCNLAPFVQFEKREKHPWKSVTFSKVAGQKPASLPKVTLLLECFAPFLFVQMVPNRAKHPSEFAINT